MARYRGVVQGSRGEASRLGHESIEAQVSTHREALSIRLHKRGNKGEEVDMVELTYRDDEELPVTIYLKLKDLRGFLEKVKPLAYKGPPW